MRKLLALLAGTFCICTNARVLEQGPSTPPDNRSLLWKISGNDMKKASFVFGTIHLICKEDYLWTAAMKKSLKQCKEVCLEMDIDDPGVMMDIATGMADNSGKTLKEYFSESDYAIIERFVKDSLGMNIGMFARMKPAALQALFATRVVTCDMPVSYETTIMEEARKQKISVTGLEEPQEQLALFDSTPEDSVVKELLLMAKDYSAERMEYREMVDAYKKQDLPMLYEIIQKAKVSGEDMNAFVDERNRKWIGRMEERMEQRPVFFAVGAGHLWGENGVINLLRQAGYKVEPVK
jgi:uncharacterized protein